MGLGRMTTEVTLRSRSLGIRITLRRRMRTGVLYR